MAIITWPSALAVPAQFTLSQARFDMAESSDSTGHQAARLFGPPRWRVSLQSADAFTLANAGQYEAMLLKLRGGVNHLALADPVRPAPQGTMRGTLTLNGAHSAGAVALSITGGAGQAATTLLPGDWLQLGSGIGTSQLVKVVDGGTANGSGVVAVNVEPPLRVAFSGGAAVTWDKPIAYYKQISQPQWSYRPALRFKQTGFALDLLENWTP
jgi:hypothetical protein